MYLLTKNEIDSALNTLNQLTNKQLKWSIKKGELSNNFIFSDFVAAFGWMTQIALYAEKLNHHPDWYHSYNNVNVSLTTHQSNGITALDFDLATNMQKRFNEMT